MSEYSFIEYLEKLEEDRGAMAALRRGLGKASGDPEMYRYVVPFLDRYRSNDWIYFTIAALYGYHHDPTIEDGRNLGASMGALERNDSLQWRFSWLLDSQSDELPSRLKSVVSLLKSKNIPIDYRRLLRDLLAWEHPDRYVQLNWARSFYQTESKNEKE
ncbi:CRISPR-associated protein, Cse2 family [Hydrogenimonas sp.]|nr:CRISPR-associated protein, Cse2 family [Hydrogenimonas sp.]